MISRKNVSAPWGEGSLGAEKVARSDQQDSGVPSGFRGTQQVSASEGQRAEEVAHNYGVMHTHHHIFGAAGT